MSKSTKSSTTNSGNGPTRKSNEVTSKRPTRPKNPITSTSNKKSTLPPKESVKPKDEDKKLTKRPAQPSLLKTNLTIPKHRPVQPAPKAKVTNTIIKARPELKPQPLRAKHNLEILNRLKETQPRSLTKNNVMNSTHNVTVSSPPPIRRESTAESFNTRERTRTRTLEPDEIVILKQREIGPRSLDSSTKDTAKKALEVPAQELDSPQLILHEPVAFEIHFEEKAKVSKERNIGKPAESTLNLRTNEKPQDSNEEEADYDDDFESYESDFESYESDFETGSSTSADDSTSSSESEKSHTPAEASEPETSDASEETQLPVTVIHKDDERKLDSGNYDMNLRRQQLQQHLQQLDSLDTSTGNSEQLDSGISYSALSNPSEKVTPEQNLTIRPSKMSKRGQELMQKIELDTITFTLFELKPIKYEYYMRMYGNFNTTQSSTQTKEDRLEAVTQTEESTTRSIWTQHPPQYDLKFMRENDSRNFSNACGEFDENPVERTENLQDPLSRSLSAMSKFKATSAKIARKQSKIDFNRLNDFLHQTAFTVASILNRPIRKKTLHTSSIPITNGFYNLDSKFMNATKVVQIFSNSKSNILIMVHDDVESLYSGDFRNLLSVWNVNEPKKPFKLLSTWSEACRVEICPESQDIVVAGLHDGSVALWDLKESYNYGVKFGSELCYFAPTQTITPCLGGEEFYLSDIGAVIDLRTFRTSQRLSNMQAHRPIQIASLNDVGILTVWTIVQIQTNNWLTPNQIDKSKMEYSSPGARFKLTQSAIYSLSDFLEQKPIRSQTTFDKTRSYFENDLFSDDALKELQEGHGKLQQGLTGLRFTSLDVGIERIYISTNRNFILSCTKTLKTEKFRKITFENSKGLFATALRLLWNEEFLTVGFSNGSVMVYNCSQKRSASESISNSEDSSKCSTPLVDACENVDLESGKSCAIQNLIRNERITHQVRPSSCLPETRPNIGSSLNLSSKNIDLRIFDKQTILGGTVLRKDLVNTIELTNDGTRLLALMDGNLRIYDFSLNSEVHTNASENIKEICLTKESCGHQNLALLTKDEDVQIHVIK